MLQANIVRWVYTPKGAFYQNMQEQYLTFRRFNNPKDANDLVVTLDSSKVPYIVEDASPSFDVTFQATVLKKRFILS